jgi:hypothetical protein
MTEGYPTSSDMTKRLCEAVIGLDGKRAEFCHLTEKQLETLQWAKDFMERYERKHKR